MTHESPRGRPGRPPSRLSLGSLALVVWAAVSSTAPMVEAQEAPLSVEAATMLALAANPDYRSRVAALEATRADLRGARSARFPSVNLSASAARYEVGGTGALDRNDLGLSVRHTLYRGGRVQAGVDAATSALAAGEGTLAAVRADLVLAVHQAWYRTAQSERLALATEEGLERSRLNLDFAEAQLQAGFGTRPDVLRARVDVSSAELELTRSRNALENDRAVLNALMGRSPAVPVLLASDSVEEPLPSLPGWEELRARALASREEIRVARARRERQEAGVRMARGAFLPSVTADGGVSRGATASQSPRESWSLGVAVALPIFEGFARSADLQAQRALLDAAFLEEAAVAQEIEGEVWAALLAEDESAQRRENAQALFEAARENLDAAQEGYRMGLGSMIELVDARTAFTGAEQILIQAVYDRRMARALLERVVQGDTFGRDRP